MVSMSSTPHPLDSFVAGVGGGDPGKGGHPMQMLEAAAAPIAVPPGEGEADDEGDRRVRKPYTITKSRESWTDPEHDKFLEALQLFDRDWKNIEAYVGSKTVIQIRSHAQKYFLKVQKNGSSEHLPPPRPKRKAAHPYPHKVSKKVPQVVLGCVIPMDTSTMATNSSANDVFPSRDSGLGQHFSPRHTQGATNNCSSSIESQSGTWPTSEAIEQEIVLPALHGGPGRTPQRLASPWSCRRPSIHRTAACPPPPVKPPRRFVDICQRERGGERRLGDLHDGRHGTLAAVAVAVVSIDGNQALSDGPPSLQSRSGAMPDFARVYSFLGSIFDPEKSGHLQGLREMDPIDVETVLLLMKNLSLNLTSPNFEEHRRLLSSHGSSMDQVKHESIGDLGSTCTLHLPFM